MRPGSLLVANDGSQTAQQSAVTPQQVDQPLSDWFAHVKQEGQPR